jgi:hypothetical protein
MFISMMKLSKNDIDVDVVMPNPHNVHYEPNFGPDETIWSWMKKNINDIELLKCRSAYVIIYFL